MKMNRVRVHPILRDLPDLDLILCHDLRRGINKVLQGKILHSAGSVRNLETQLGAHTAIVIKNLPHFILNSLELHGKIVHDRSISPHETDGLIRNSRQPPVGPGGGKGHAIVVIVGALSDDDRLLPGCEYAVSANECGLERGKIRCIVVIRRRGAA